MALPKTRNLFKSLRKNSDLKKCDICKKKFNKDTLITGHGIRQEIESLIKKKYPKWKDSNLICKADYKKYRIEYIKKLIKEESSNLLEIKDVVLKSINEYESTTLEEKHSSKENVIEVLSFGDNVSDKVARFGGSWKFILFFFFILAGWIIANSYLFINKPFDPYPFILMNLILSCIAAIQAPIIMMSQNRQEIKDRLDSETDHKINLKSAVEIRTLQEKVDHLLLDQWSRMMKIQDRQLKILQELNKKI